jgi:8-oxo-dGTP pyrophosphatase MutT (NUDIX family)
VATVPVPEFVAGLRRRVGTDLLWLSGVSAVVLHEGRVLLAQRPSGRWSVVSGILEPGEQPARAVVREVLEETGTEVEVEHLVDVVTQEPMAYENGDRAQYLDLTFRCRYLGGEAHVADDENLAVAWFALDDLPDLAERDRQRIGRALSPAADGQPRFER